MSSFGTASIGSTWIDSMHTRIRSFGVSGRGRLSHGSVVDLKNDDVVRVGKFVMHIVLMKPPELEPLRFNSDFYRYAAPANGEFGSLDGIISSEPRPISFASISASCVVWYHFQ